MSVSIQALNVMRFPSMGGLKSTQERQERQQKCASQVEFFEKQKENLKNMQCTSLEDIERKLDMFHSYEDQIAEAKKQYNNSQMSHVLDEAREIGEKIAEAADKTAPKTLEEREKERVEEALGTEEENKGMLSEIMEEITEVADEIQEELEEQLEEELTEELQGEELGEELTEELQGEGLEEGLTQELQGEALEEGLTQETAGIGEEVQAVETLTEKTLAEAVKEHIEQTMIFRTADRGQYPHIDYRL